MTAIPALLISVAGALITTRSGTDDELATDLTGQVFSNPRPLGVAAGALAALGLVPGLPTAAFLTLGGVVGGLSLALRRSQRRAEEAPPEEVEPTLPAEEPIEPLLQIDALTIEVGYDLVELAGSEKPGGLLERIRGIRRQIAMDMGIVVPPVRVRDNLRLQPDAYRILLRGAEIGRAQLVRGRVLAIDPGNALEQIEGQKTTDPAFGIPALWIDEKQADHARSVGFTVVDRPSVLATHLSELIRKHAPDLLGRQETQKLLDMLGKTAPKLIEELIPEQFTLGQVQKVLQALLRERVSVRDLQTICETMADAAGASMPFEDLLARVRQSLARALVQPLVEHDQLKVLTVSGQLEEELRQLVAPGPDGLPAAADPRTTQSLIHRVANAVQSTPSGGQPVVLCGRNDSRYLLRKLTHSVLPTVSFLSVHEIPEGVHVHAVGQVS